ncbi:MAG: hypothetical protein M1828_000907 [Chrysothrix sp. TS-e1954]|nr:MAG: hypothetical protein M1828_000907 [Chrysothrix sp. TS-e1954]
MQALRRSVSFYRAGTSENDEWPRHSHFSSETTGKLPRSRSSADNFVIPGRTRYPSNTSPRPALEDFVVAEKLLRHEPTQPSRDHHERYTPARVWGQARADHSEDTLATARNQHNDSNFSKSRVESSSEWSVFSLGRSSAGSLVSKDHTPMIYIKLYNQSARRIGLQKLELPADQENEPSLATNTNPKYQRKKRFWRRLAHPSSTKTHGEVCDGVLKKKSSIGDLLGLRPRPAIKCKSLEDIFRLGGAGLLHLPPSFTGLPLVVPTCLAATGNFLADNARFIPGIFRIPGQASNVNMLYDHYKSRLDVSESGQHQIRSTMALCTIPADCNCSTHDVASTFKRFLSDLPEGVFGSIGLYRTLKEIEVCYKAGRCLDTSVSRLVALAILSLRSSRRIALIAAIFGLLAHLKHDNGDRDAEIAFSKIDQRSESMSSKALGVVFAPTLLGSLIEDIDVEEINLVLDDRSHSATPSKSFKHHFKTPKHNKTISVDRSPEMNASIERSQAAASLIELMLIQWKDIASQIRAFRAGPHSHHHRERLDPHRHRPSLLSDAHRDSTMNSVQPYSDPSRGESQGLSSQIEHRSSQNSNQLESSEPMHDDHVWHMPLPTPSPSEASPGHRSSEERAHSSNGSDRFQVATQLNRLTSDAPQLELTPSTAFDALTSPSQPAVAWWGSPVATLTSSEAIDFPSRVAKAPSPENAAAGSRNNSGSTVVVSSVPRMFLDDAEDKRNADVFSSSEVLLKSDIDSSWPAGTDMTKNETTIEAGPLHTTVVRSMQSVTKTQLPSAAEQKSSEQLTREVSVPSRPHCDGTPECLDESFSSSIASRHTIRGSSQGSPIHLKRPSPSFIPKPISSSAKKLRQSSKTPALNLRTPPTDRDSEQADSTQHRPALRGQSKLPSQVSMTKRVSTVPEQRLQKPENYNLKQPVAAPEETSETLRIASSLAAGSATISVDAEPAIAKQIVFKPAQEKSKDDENAKIKNDDVFWQDGPQRTALGTLYAEIGKLRHELEVRCEEAKQLHHELDAMRQYTSSGTLSQKLREAERATRAWKHRAEAAEAVLHRRRTPHVNGDSTNSVDSMKH